MAFEFIDLRKQLRIERANNATLAANLAVLENAVVELAQLIAEVKEEEDGENLPKED